MNKTITLKYKINLVPELNVTPAEEERSLTDGSIALFQEDTSEHPICVQKAEVCDIAGERDPEAVSLVKAPEETNTGNIAEQSAIIIINH